jgi:hypothetical protein
MTEKLEPVDRTCATCACCKIEINPVDKLHSQAFCRRNTPVHGRVRVDVPRLDRDKKPVIGKNGAPILEQEERSFYVYPPTQPDMVCFDGWRPMGTLPGDKWDMLDIIKPFREGLEQIRSDMLRDLEQVDPSEKKN